MNMRSTSGTDLPGMRRRARESAGESVARGFYILMPLFIIGLAVHKLILVLQDILSPVLNRLPGKVLRSPSVRFLLLCLLVAAALALVGLLARRRSMRAVGAWLESVILNKLPFYSRLRGLTSTLAARDDAHSMKAARVTVDVPGFEQLGVILERHLDGSATVFLPSSPNASSGTVAIVEPARIREVNISLRSIVGCMGRYGHGTATLLEKAETPMQESMKPDGGTGAGGKEPNP